jgi:hypothetical protein
MNQCEDQHILIEQAVDHPEERDADVIKIAFHGSVQFGNHPRNQECIEQQHAQPEQPDHAEQPNDHWRAPLGRDVGHCGNNRIGNAAKEAPDVVGGIRLYDQREQDAAKQRVHQRRQNEIRQMEIPKGEK